jgi:hypothetical protein
MLCEGMCGLVAGGFLGVVGGQGLVKDHDVLVASQGHPIGIQEAGWLCFLPDDVIAEALGVSHYHGGGKGALPKQQDSTMRLDNPLRKFTECSETLFRRDNDIPGVLGGAIGQVAENHVNGCVFYFGQPFQAVNVINMVLLHTSPSL